MSDVCWFLIACMSAIVCVASWRTIGRIADDYEATRKVSRALGLRAPPPGLTLLEVVIGLLVLFVSAAVALDALGRCWGAR